MKPIQFFIVFLGFSVNTTVAQSNRQVVPSKIEKVTLFTSGAQVTRKASVQLMKGKTDLVFDAISPDIDKASIQVNGQGEFTIISVIHQINYLNEQKRQEEAVVLLAKKEVLLQKLIVEKNMLAVFKNEEQMLLKNQQVGGSSSGLKTSDLKEAVDFHRLRMTENLAKQAEYNEHIYKVDSTIKKLDAQLRSLNQPKDFATSEVVVTVSANANTQGVFELSYFTAHAGWYANYDLRVTDVASPLDLDFKAHVFQHSGEDWKDVKLTISNGNPTESGVAPQLQPWHLGFGYPAGIDVISRALSGRAPGVVIRGSLLGNAIRGRVTDKDDGSPVPGVQIAIKGTSVGTASDANGNYSLQYPVGARSVTFSSIGFVSEEVPITGSEIDVALEPDVKALNEVVVTAYGIQSKRRIKSAVPSSTPLEVKESFQTTTQVFEIELPYTILNDGKNIKVDVKKQSLPAIYEYLTVPKLEKSAFLMAKIVDWQEYNLMEGEVNLYFEGAFLGKSVLDVKNAGDTLTISLGKDKGIVVDRKKLKNFSKNQFLSNSRVESRAYEISVRSSKKTPVNIVVLDHLPIPTTKEISLEDTEHKEAELNETTKTLTWKFEIQPRQEKKLLLKYTVKYPKEKIIILE